MTVATYSQLADRLEKRHLVSPGQSFARRSVRTSKEQARNIALSTFRTARFPKGLTLVTFPGLDWSFERQLILNRERGRATETSCALRRTYLTCLERDEAVYRAALGTIPGRSTGIICLPSPPFARDTVRTHKIGRYHRCDFETFAYANTYRFVGAWLDFVGPLTDARLDALIHFWTYGIKDTLIVTLLNARQQGRVREQMAEVGGLVPFLSNALPDAELRLACHYCDSSPMVQMIFERRLNETSKEVA